MVTTVPAVAVEWLVVAVPFPSLVTVTVNVGATTVILKSCVKLVVAVAPFVIVALTVTVPADVVFRVLPPVMVAPVVPTFSTLQTMVRFVALFGVTVPLRVRF